MSLKHQIENIAKRYIKSHHTIGDRAGGSGHMGHSSYTLNECNFKQLENGNIEVKFKYTIITESEFSYDPDSAPGEEKHEASLLLNRDLKIIEPD